MRAAFATLTLVLTVTPMIQAQATPWRFQWKAGDVLHYRVQHHTTVTEVAKDAKSSTTSKLNVVKRWQVLDVDARGVATLQLSLVSLRNEQIRPNGDVLLFDSAQPEKSTPALKDAMMKFLGKPLAVLRVDSSGKVVEVKSGDAQRDEAEPPFHVILPDGAIAAGKTWQRSYAVTLAPPHGTGERFDVVQTCACKALRALPNGLFGIVQLKTTFKKLPESPLDQVPLWQKQPEGEITFDVTSGRLHSAHLRTVREIRDHQGPGSSYRFESSYTEELVPAPVK